MIRVVGGRRKRNIHVAVRRRERNTGVVRGERESGWIRQRNICVVGGKRSKSNEKIVGKST